MPTLGWWPALWQACKTRAVSTAQQQATGQPRAQHISLCWACPSGGRKAAHTCLQHALKDGRQHRRNPLSDGHRQQATPQHSRDHQTTSLVVSAPSAENCQVANEVVDCILFAHTVVGPMAKRQKVFLVLDVLLAFWAKAIGVEALWPGESLQQEVQGVGGLCRVRCRVQRMQG